MASAIGHCHRVTPNLTDTLCTRCGLCCDGSLFADVELAGRAEATRLEVLGLEVEEGDGGGLLQLPCGALRGRMCGIYPHRPECCRTFECRLLQETRRGTVSVERAGEIIRQTLARIARVKELLRRLGERGERLPLKERCAEALAGASSRSPAASRTREELEAAMSSVERLIRSSFL
jgi:Fe-S-cluster containining protein